MGFQSSKPIVVGFLSKAITDHSPRTRSSFTECIILATICGRSLSYRQQYSVKCVYGDVSQGIWDQHRWLDAILTRRIEILSLNYPSAAEMSDPMLFFMNMLAQATVLYLCKGIESVPWTTDEGRAMVIEYEQRSLSAAQEIINLTKALAQLSFFKASSSYFLRHFFPLYLLE
jgi:hypothetical protein